MFGGWKIIVQVCLPIPFILLILLALPAPRAFHRAVISLVDKTLGITFLGTLSLLHVMLVVTGTCFLASVKTTSDLLAQKPTDSEASPNVIAGHLGKRWRAERNFWISFICFTLWCLLARYFQIMKEKAREQDELRGIKGPKTASSKPVEARKVK